MYPQDKVDAAVKATSGESNRVDETVVAVRERDGSLTFHVVGTEERVRYGSGPNRNQAECTVEDGWGTIQEAFDNRKDDDHGVFEFRFWSELDAYRDACDVVAEATVSAPWMYAGTAEEREDHIIELAKQQMIEAGDIDADDLTDGE